MTKSISMRVLVLNAGSSSIKFELFQMPDCKVEAKGLLQRIGEPNSELKYKLGGEDHQLQEPVKDHAQGLTLITRALTDTSKGGLKDISEIGAIGHRVVHGGEAFSKTVLISG